MLKIDQDLRRFDQKIRDLKKEALQKYFQREDLGYIGSNGKVLQVPIRKLNIPQFKFKDEDTGGISMGPGDIGMPIPFPGEQQNEESEGEEAHRPGGYQAREYDLPINHEFAEVSRSEVAEGLEEYLKLPNLRETFGGDIIGSPHEKYNTIRKVGPKSLTNFKRTYKTALKRLVTSGSYTPEGPVIPVNEDLRFKAIKKSNDDAKAVIVYMLDCSGSMLGTISFLQETAWLADCWIENNYPTMVRRYLHYDHFARESSREDFFNIAAGGENNMGVAYLRAHKMLSEYPQQEYNKFVIHLTDGDHFGLNISKRDIKRYKEASKLYPEYFPELNLVIGNPLLDLVLPECNALFVCEAGAYYDRGGIGMSGPGLSSTNYSEVLAKLVKGTPSLEKKLRFVSYNSDRLKKDRNECKMETLRKWFKA